MVSEPDLTAVFIKAAGEDDCMPLIMQGHEQFISLGAGQTRQIKEEDRPDRLIPIGQCNAFHRILQIDIFCHPGDPQQQPLDVLL